MSFLARNLLSGARLCTEGSSFGAAQNGTNEIDTLASLVKASGAPHAHRETLEGRTSIAVVKVRVHAAGFHKIWLGIAARSRAASAPRGSGRPASSGLAEHPRHGDRAGVRCVTRPFDARTMDDEEV